MEFGWKKFIHKRNSTSAKKVGRQKGGTRQDFKKKASPIISRAREHFKLK